MAQWPTPPEIEIYCVLQPRFLLLDFAGAAEAFRLAPGDWPNVLAGLRWLATTMTALLTIRFVYVSWNGNRAASPASGCGS